MKKRTLSPEAKARKAAYDKEWRAKNKERVAEYHQRYYQENQEKVLLQQQEYYARNPERKRRRGTLESARESAQESRRRRRKEVLEFLGGKCVRCGIDDWRVLELDHINRRADEERQSGYNATAIWNDVFKHGRAKYQALCANCHRIKTYEEE